MEALLTVVESAVLSAVSDQIEEYCNTSFVTSEQHVDGRSSRVERDNLDI